MRASPSLVPTGSKPRVFDIFVSLFFLPALCLNLKLRQGPQRVLDLVSFRVVIAVVLQISQPSSNGLTCRRYPFWHFLPIHFQYGLQIPVFPASVFCKHAAPRSCASIPRGRNESLCNIEQGGLRGSRAGAIVVSRRPTRRSKARMPPCWLVRPARFLVSRVPSNVSGCEQTVKSIRDMVCAVPLRMLQVPRPELNRCTTRKRSA